MSELKPCPFCGGEAKVAVRQVCVDCVETRVECCNCDASCGTIEAPYAESDYAIAEWNRRDYSKVLKAIDECEKWLECKMFINGSQLKEKIKELSK